MASFDLFPREHVVGIFRGFQEGGLEFHADLVLPYRNDFQNIHHARPVRVGPVGDTG
jgi:hypothetical protein